LPRSWEESYLTQGQQMELDEFGVEETDFLIPQEHVTVFRKQRTWYKDTQIWAFLFIGFLTFAYCVVEIVAALFFRSLTLLSDGFHNLSDVLSLLIAFWAAMAARKEKSETMSYGWIRAEVLGGVANACFLLSLCLYIVLETIPRFIKPEHDFSQYSGYPFIIVAAGGLIVNTLGTIIFAATGLSHGHSHGGGGHGHSHGGGKKKGKKKHGHGHGHGHEHGHGHKKKTDKSHSHSHSKKKDKSHSHSHSESSCCSCKWASLNVYAVFLHYLGDMFSSFIVLLVGIILKFVKGSWTDYIDPAASLVVVFLIVVTTVPLVRRSSMILLQSTPTTVELGEIRRELQELQGVENVHDLHVWQLVEDQVIGSVHLSVEEGVNFAGLLKTIKAIFHSHHIHSTTIQPEFVPKFHPSVKAGFCETNCVPGCEEDWCCKPSEKKDKKGKKEKKGMVPAGDIESQGSLHFEDDFEH